ISTTTNNSLVFSVAANNRDLPDVFHFWRVPQPTNTLTSIWGGMEPPNQPEPPYRPEKDANPVAGSSAGSLGVLSSAGVIEVVEPYEMKQEPPDGLGPTAMVNVVAAFKPFVPSVPMAERYVPVVLYETFSGPVNYQAIGSSLRTNQSWWLPIPELDCAIMPEHMNTTAELKMPPGSTVKAAFLYWAGSGTAEDADAEVMFGPMGQKFEVVADQVFLAESVTGPGADFFGAYAEVTGLVTGNGKYQFSNLTVQTGQEWSDRAICAGGWTLV